MEAQSTFGESKMQAMGSKDTETLPGEPKEGSKDTKTMPGVLERL